MESATRCSIYLPFSLAHKLLASLAPASSLDASAFDGFTTTPFTFVVLQGRLKTRINVSTHPFPTFSPRHRLTVLTFTHFSWQLVYLAHIGACIFVAIGRLETSPQRWLEVFSWNREGEAAPLSEARPFVKYSAALYWSVITLASVSTSPVFNTMVLLRDA
jgi:hypothetical protein